VGDRRKKFVARLNFRGEFFLEGDIFGIFGHFLSVDDVSQNATWSGTRRPASEFIMR
jgi:hypothetical protein